MSNNSRTADKFVVRMRPGQRDRVQARANREHRAMNDVCTMAIDRYLDQQEAFDHLLALIKNGITLGRLTDLVQQASLEGAELQALEDKP